MKILIVPGNVQTPKSYPYWNELIGLLTTQGHEIKQIKDAMLPIPEIIAMVNHCDVWISIDSFLPHLVAYHNLKSGIVLWGKSDPLIFGHPTNTNLLKDRKYLRPDQFRWWRDVEYTPDAFVSPEVIIQEINCFKSPDSI